jgi:enoyl-CoA hydratase/carnithine racemase
VIRLEVSGGLWTAIIDRPDKANSLTGAMLADLADIAERAATEAHVLLLTGTGTVFSAGADLEAARAGLATDPVWERLSGALARLPCLTIAALNGTLAGGAFGMALACDLRIAVPEARFFYPVMQLGFLPQPSDPARLTALVGPSRARMILMAGQRIDAATALSWGLIDAVAPREDLQARAAELAAAALAADRAHVAGIKALCAARSEA